LEFAKDISFLNLIEESDASIVVSTLNVHQQSSTYVDSILHVRREANQAPKYLTKYALYNLDCIWIEEILSCVSAILAFDLLQDFVDEIVFNVEKKIQFGSGKIFTKMA